jgi:hypothetical protein
LGVFTTVRHSEVYLEKHKPPDVPEFGWQTKDIGYGDTVRLTHDGKIEQRFVYAGHEPWIDIQYHGGVLIYAHFPGGRWVEYEAQFVRGRLQWIELLYDGTTQDRFKLAERDGGE